MEQALGGFVFFALVMGIALVTTPPLANVTLAAGARHASHNSNTQLSLPQVVAIAVARNLRMADSRLAVREREHQRREAFSDFFPSINLQYVANSGQVYELGIHRRVVGATKRSMDDKGNRFGGAGAGLFPLYPYNRIDPFETSLLLATMTQPLFTGGKLLSDYKYAQLGVNYQAIQYHVDRQDLILDTTEAYYQLIQGEKELQVADSAIRALEAVRNQSVEFYKAGVVAKVDVLSTEGQLAQARVQKTQALSDIEQAKASLCFLLRYPQEAPIKVVEDIAYRPNPYRIPEIYATAAGTGSKFARRNISVDQALALIRSAKVTYFLRSQSRFRNSA